MAQLKATTVNGALTVTGVATFGNTASTRQGLNYIGANPVALNTDTTSTWAGLGTGVAYISTSGIITNQPSATGFIENKVSNGNISQTWYSMDGSGSQFTRSGTNSGWQASGAWLRVVTDNFVGKTLWTGTLSANGTASIPEINDYNIFFIKFTGKGTMVPALRYGTSYLRGVGGYAYSSTLLTTYEMSADISGTTITLKAATQRDHGTSGHTSVSSCTVSEIIGII